MALNPALFTLLGIYNGPWTPISGTTGGPGNDLITVGSILNLVVFGNGGNDYIDSRAAGVVNVLNGGADSDQIFGGSGVNTINGGPGNDYIEGGGGADILNGGPGIDTLSYESAEPVRGTSTGVTVTLNASGGGTVSGGANVGVDVITGGFENIVGSNFDDTLTGNTGNNILIGLAGNDFLFGREGDDTLVGGAGADTFTGGVGIDTADYSTSPGGGNVDLSTASGSGSDAQGDTFSTIENVTGSAFSDVITGDTGNNVLRGLVGADTLNGGAGNDVLDARIDRPLPTTPADGNNVLDGGTGDDLFFVNRERPATLGMNPGSDEIRGGEGIDTIQFDGTNVEADMLAGKIHLLYSAFPTIEFSTMKFEENLIGSNELTVTEGIGRGDILVGDHGDNRLTGRFGPDVLTGNGGADTFVYLKVDDSYFDNATNQDRNDTIEDFSSSQGDKIDLSAIDAIAGNANANDAFTYIGSAGFSAAGQVRYAGGQMEANINADLGADMQISVDQLVAADFIL